MPPTAPAPAPSARAPAAEIAFDRQRSLTLPCGRAVVVVPLDGFCQNQLTPDREGRFDDPYGAMSAVLSRVVKSVDGRRPQPSHLADMVTKWPHGSRTLAFLWARTLTYGSACDVAWRCEPKAGGCGHQNRPTVELDELPVAPYDRGLLERGLEVAVRSRAGAEYVFRVRLDSGDSHARYHAALAAKEASIIDAPLAQVVLVSVNSVEAKVGSAKTSLATLLGTTPGDVLDHLRYFVRLLEPRTFLDEAHRAKWVAKANAYLREHCRLPAADVEAPAGGPTGDAEGADGPAEGGGEGGLEAFDGGGTGGADEAPEALLVPQGGVATRFQVACGKCGAASWQSVESTLDFFAPHLKDVVDD